MELRDLGHLALAAVLAHRLRSVLTVLGILIGVASVILLTSLGEGTRRFVLSEFTQFGTDLVAINPGKVQTTGIPGALGATLHKLTIADAEALRRVPGVESVVPVALGMARVEAGELSRSVFVYGVNSELPRVWKFRVRQGRFLPESDLGRSAAITVLGPRLKRELFGERNALGQFVRIAGRRFQVIGVMEPKGQLLGFDLDDTAYLPVGAAQQLFNRDDLIEIDVTVSSLIDLERVLRGIRERLVARHGGEEDFTITSQVEMLKVADRVLGVVSAGVVAIGAISLLVGAIGILTMMWISVNERTAEIGLAKAIGATPGQILALFLAEASLLSLVGGGLGIAAGAGIAGLARLAVPGLPVQIGAAYVLLALLMSLLVGMASGALPARRAARLDPLEALRAE